MSVTRLGVALCMLGYASVTYAAKIAPLGPEWTEIQPGGETLCGRGEAYAFFVRAGDPGRVVVDFVGGGACWSAATCHPDHATFSDSVDSVRDKIRGDALPGVYDQAREDNPYRGWTHLVVPYCTGDVHWGARDTDYLAVDGTRFTIHHRGAVNARAALDWLAASGLSPQQMHVTGTSAGSYGALYWMPHLREAYPSAGMTELGDAGVGVITNGFMGTAMERWNVTAHAPRWIPSLDPDAVDWSRLDVAEIVRRLAAHYPEARIAQYSTAFDQVQTGFYVLMGGAAFLWPAKMQGILDDLAATSPNFTYYVAPGKEHCITTADAFYTTLSNDVGLRDWVEALLNAPAPPASVRCDDCLDGDSR